MTSSNLTSRRNFLRTSVLGSAAVAAAWRFPSAQAAETTQAAAAATSRVALVAGDDRANIAFKSLEPFKKQIAAAIGNKRVILKPNNVVLDRPLCASHADNLEGILEFLHSIGKKNIILAESTARGSTLEGFSNYGYNRLGDKYHIKMLELDSLGHEIRYILDEKSVQPIACRVSSALLDHSNNFIISAAKLKTHNLVGATLSLKNIVLGAGVKDSTAKTAKSDKPLMHGSGPHGINYNLFMLSAELHPDLAVIDGYQGMEGDGPANGTPVDQKVCLASMDWLAADRVGVELMGIDVNKIGYLTYATKAGDRGQGDLSKIEILGPAIKDVAKVYQPTPHWNQIITWQNPVMPA